MLTRDVVIQGLRPTLFGLIVGVAGGAGAASAIRVLLFDVTPGDASTYVAAAAALLVVAIASSWIPARRAARIDPSAALRSE
jgi:ABC-type antimicrobial peptide transport system permease subunit